MDKYEIIFNALQERVNTGELTIEKAEQLNDLAYEKYVTESFTKSPLKNMIPQLKKIKDEKPGEYDDQKDVKKFVDKYYDDLTKASTMLQEEPEKLTKDNRNYLITLLISVVTYMASMGVMVANPAVGLGMFVISFMWILVSDIAYVIIRNARVNADVTAGKELSKIKTALKKLDKAKLPDSYKKKVSKLIQEIDDAETDLYEKLKVKTESAYENIADDIQTSVNNAELTYEEGVNMNITAYGKLMTEDK